MTQAFRLSSSLRAKPLEVTLSHARAIARSLGITRVTDITRLDCVGVPVFASIRPDAQPGSLCVNAGKGLTINEARVGAYMEAIEFAFAEYNRASLKVPMATARDVFDGAKRPTAILDFCPVMGTEIELDAPLACVEAKDICSGTSFLVPAELVFLPFPRDLGHNSYFGANSNGLCSGNSILEATVHGLAEVIERDICSFQAITDDSILVENRSLPKAIRDVQLSLASAGMSLYVRHRENDFDLPYFTAVVAETASQDPIYITVGYGCHPCKEIAVTRAVCEALQSRLSFIHGGRDDLSDRYQRFKGWSSKARRGYAKRLLAKVSTNGSPVRFGKLRDHSANAVNLKTTLAILLDALARNNLQNVLRVTYTAKNLPLQVVRIIVPGLECFTEATTRVGLRLRNYVSAQL